MQGFNMGRYVPPSALDAGLSANQASGKGHALGSRARKAHLGILTVRFEMPFAVWCSTCPEKANGRLIGQGVRFNAEKKRVGNYYTTPIWQFRMKHAVCGGWLEIRTDPKSGDFVVTEGGKRRDLGEDVGVGAMLKEESEREKRRADAFAALEVTVDDKRRVQNEAGRIEELKSLKQRDWSDPDAASQKLRRGFRAGRKVREKAAEATEALQDKMSLGIDLLDESESDRARARLVDFGEDAGDATTNTSAAISKPLFTHPPPPPRTSTNHKAASKAPTLRQQLAQNTRAAIDPFLQTTPSPARHPSSKKEPTIQGLKRRSHPAAPQPQPSAQSLSPQHPALPAADPPLAHHPSTATPPAPALLQKTPPPPLPSGALLVAYDSD